MNKSYYLVWVTEDQKPLLTNILNASLMDVERTLYLTIQPTRNRDGRLEQYSQLKIEEVSKQEFDKYNSI